MISRVRLPDRQSGRFLTAGLTALRRSLFDFISYGIVGYPRGKYLVMVLVSETLGVYGNIFPFRTKILLPSRQWYTKDLVVKLWLRLIVLSIFWGVSIQV